jgi:hypothetical protein
MMSAMASISSTIQSWYASHTTAIAARITTSERGAISWLVLHGLLQECLERGVRGGRGWRRLRGRHRYAFSTVSGSGPEYRKARSGCQSGPKERGR